eukprot:3633031-Pyramimonas_sp.AAC.1
MMLEDVLEKQTQNNAVVTERNIQAGLHIWPPAAYGSRTFVDGPSQMGPSDQTQSQMGTVRWRPGWRRLAHDPPAPLVGWVDSCSELLVTRVAFVVVYLPAPSVVSRHESWGPTASPLIIGCTFPPFAGEGAGEGAGEHEGGQAAAPDGVGGDHKHAQPVRQPRGRAAHRHGGQLCGGQRGHEPAPHGGHGAQRGRADAARLPGDDPWSAKGARY